MSPRSRSVVPDASAEALLAALVDSTSDAIIGKTLDSVVTSWNAAAERIFGFTSDEMVGKSIDRILPPAKRDEERAIIARAAQGQQTLEYETERITKRGDVISVALTVSPITIDGDQVVGVSTIARDITERKKAETRLAALVNSTSDAIIGKTLDSVVTSWNAAAERMFGYRAEEIVGRSVDLILPAGRRDEERNIIQRAARGEQTREYETERLTKSGELLPVALTVSPITRADGSVLGVSTIARDITERRKAEATRREAATYARSLIEASLDPLVTISAQGTITDVNKATEVVTGASREELIGSDFSEYFTQPEKARQGYKKVFDEGSVTDYPLALRHKSGRVVDVLYNASVYRDAKGRVVGVFAAARDVTERKKSDEKTKAASAYARSLIEASLDPLVTISPDGKVTDVNRATELVTGVPRTRLIGTDFSEYFTEPEKAREGYQLVFSQGSVKDYGLAIRHASGRVTDVLYNAAVYRDTSGNVLGVFAAARDVTERKKSEALQEAASEYARSLIEASLDPLVTISPDGKITDVNRATEVVTGVVRDELVGSDFSTYFTHPEQAREGYKKVFEEGSVTDYPLAIRHASGSVTDVLYNASVYKDPAGRVLGVFAAARDVTERKKADEKTKAASAYARSLIEASLDPLVTISPDGKITDVNRATETATGVARERLIGSDFSDYFVEPDKAREGYKKVFDEGKVTDYPLAIRHANGSVADVLYNASVYRDAAGTVLGVFAAARDVTERKKSDEKTKAASAYARSLIEASLDPLVTISPDGKITDVNRATELATGIPREVLVGTDFWQYFTEPDKAREGYQLVFSQGSVKDYPLAIRDASGHVTDVLYNAAVYRDAHGNVAGVFAAARDVTDRQRAEALQQAASAYARSLIEASLDPLVTISPGGKITDVNRATEGVTGVPRERLIGSDFSDYFTQPEKAREGYKRVFEAGKVTDYPLAIRHANGSVTEVLYNAAPYRDASGKVLGVFAAARDITEQKALQSQVESRNRELEVQNKRVEEANRLKSEFLANMSHELRTPLNGIIGYSEFLGAGRAGPLTKQQAEHVTDIHNSGRHLLQLINDVLDLSKVESGRTELAPETFDPRAALDEVVSVLKPTAQARHIRLKVEVLGAPATVHLDLVRFKQIAFNLLSNAVKFTDDGGSVDATLRCDEDECTLAVHDTGIGIAPADQARLFQPFVQLDAGLGRRYEGSGLGLALTKRLVEMQGGTIDLESELRKGSTFTVHMPRNAGKEVAA